jgi:hypothetical protein
MELKQFQHVVSFRLAMNYFYKHKLKLKRLKSSGMSEGAFTRSLFNVILLLVLEKEMSNPVRIETPA